MNGRKNEGKKASAPVLTRGRGRTRKGQAVALGRGKVSKIKIKE